MKVGDPRPKVMSFIEKKLRLTCMQTLADFSMDTCMNVVNEKHRQDTVKET